MNYHSTLNFGRKVYNLFRNKFFNFLDSFKVDEKVSVLKETMLFDADFYLKKYEGVAGNIDSAELHYLKSGAKEGLNPSRYFDNKYYLSLHPEVVAEKKNPLLHYIRFGKSRYHSPHPLFQHETALEFIDINQVQERTLFEHYLKNRNLWSKSANKAFNFEEILGPGKVEELISKDIIPLMYIIENNLFDSKNYSKTMSEKVALAMQNKDYEQVETILNSYAQVTESPQKKASVYNWESILEYARKNGNVRKKFPDEKINLTAPKFVADEKSVNYEKKEITIAGPQVLQFRNVKHVAGTRIVIDEQLKLLHEELEFCLDGRYEARHLGFKHIDKDKVVLECARSSEKIKSGIVISSEYDENYFHWAIESLPKVMVAEESDLPQDIPFLVCEGMHGNLIALLNIVNKKNRPIKFVKKDNLYDVEDLFYVSDCSRQLNLYNGKIQPDDILTSAVWVGKVRELILSSFPEMTVQEPFRKIYFVRRPGSIRRVVNEEALIEKLIERKFELISPADLSAVAQIKVMLQSKLVIGASGAAFTNLLFSPKGSRAIILNSTHPNANLYGYNQLGDVSQIDLQFVLGGNEYDLIGKYGVHDNFHISESLLFKLIDEK